MAAAGGPMKVSPARATICAKVGVFGQEAVARVDGLTTVVQGRVDDLFLDQVGISGPSARPDENGFVGLLHVPGAGVDLGVDGHRPDPQTAGRSG